MLGLWEMRKEEMGRKSFFLIMTTIVAMLKHYSKKAMENGIWYKVVHLAQICGTMKFGMNIEMLHEPFFTGINTPKTEYACFLIKRRIHIFKKEEISVTSFGY